MAIDMPNRVQQIATRLTPVNQNAILYTPSSATVLGIPINYNGAMATIRIAAYIDSTLETFAPIILPTDTLARKEQKNQMFRSQPKKGLMIYLQNPTGTNFEIAMIDLYNVKPIFLTGANEFFTDLDAYGIKFGWKIFAQIIDRGFGLLQNNTDTNKQNDWVSITGFINETSSFLQGNDDTVYNFII